MTINPIAFIRTDLPEKFGVPRQSGLAPSLSGRIIFTPEYRDLQALRGLEDFSHIWLIWGFSANSGRSDGAYWQPTVRPPRLGGNKSMGVFATRSPFRPNSLGLSCVELEGIDIDSEDGPVIRVKGADLMDGTPVYDIKPYVRYADSRPEARCGYVDELQERSLDVDIPLELTGRMGDKLEGLVEILSIDPRPSYHNDPHREYGVSFAGRNIRFYVMGGTVHVTDIEVL